MVDIDRNAEAVRFDMIAAADDAVEKLISTDDTKMAFHPRAPRRPPIQRNPRPGRPGVPGFPQEDSPELDR